MLIAQDESHVLLTFTKFKNNFVTRMLNLLREIRLPEKYVSNILIEIGFSKVYSTGIKVLI